MIKLIILVAITSAFSFINPVYSQDRKPYGQNPNDLGYKSYDERKRELREQYEANKRAEKAKIAQHKQQGDAKKQKSQSAEEIRKEAEDESKQWLGWKPLAVGDVGAVERFKVTQVLDENHAIVDMFYTPYVAYSSQKRKTVLLNAPTKDLADDDVFTTQQIYEITGTKQLELAIGGTKTYYVLKPKEVKEKPTQNPDKLKQANPSANNPKVAESQPKSFKERLSTIEVISATFGSTEHTKIIVDKKEISPLKGIARGLFVVALEKDKIILNQIYDVLGNASTANQFADAINKLPNGTFVIVAVNDEATSNFNENAQKALLSIGGKTGLLGKPFRSSYYCIGQKGMKEGMAIEELGKQDVHYPK